MRCPHPDDKSTKQPLHQAQRTQWKGGGKTVKTRGPGSLLDIVSYIYDREVTHMKSKQYNRLTRSEQYNTNCCTSRHGRNFTGLLLVEEL